MRLQHFLSRDERLGRRWLLLEPVQKQLVMPTRHILPLQRLQRGLHVLLAQPLEQRIRLAELYGGELPDRVVNVATMLRAAVLNGQWKAPPASVCDAASCSRVHWLGHTCTTPPSRLERVSIGPGAPREPSTGWVGVTWRRTASIRLFHSAEDMTELL